MCMLRCLTAYIQADSLVDNSIFLHQSSDNCSIPRVNLVSAYMDCILEILLNGERGIRTLVEVAPKQHFQC
ncbi:MAG: hypothetical protein ACRDEA_11835, partial [Microcystaceae cyanobacterium]